MIPLSDDEILRFLSPQGINEIFRIQKYDEISDNKVYTGSVILIFDVSREIPSFVFCDKVKVPVNHFSPKPMLCRHCGLLGHTDKKCKRIEVNLCQICFHSHGELDRCIKVCRNCNEDHFSDNKKCIALRNELRILKVKEAH